MNATNGVLMVIGSALRIYREYLLRSAAARARSAGLRLVLINNLKPTWQRGYVEETVVADIFDYDTLLGAARQVAGRRSVVGVMCADEPLVMHAAGVAAEFGVPGLSVPGAAACRDKQNARTRLTAAGLHQPAFEMTTTLEQARAAAARIGFPVVVKPRALGASIGVVLAADEAALEEAFRVASAASMMSYEQYRGGALVEGFARGPEISIDGAVHRGDYLPMFVARKQTGRYPYFEEIGHVVDGADPLLADPALLATLDTAHRALGIQDGLTHTEVRLTARGPLVIEVNGRLGGDLIPFLGQAATGIDPGRVLVDVALGSRPDVRPVRRTVAGIRFGYPVRDCVVRSVSVPADAPGLLLAARMIEPGTRLHLPPGGYIARHSLVVCQADDPATCARRLDAASALVDVRVEPIDPPVAGSLPRLPAGLLDVDH